MRLHVRLFIACSILCSGVPFVHAQNQHLEPELVRESSDLEAVLDNRAGSTSQVLEGKGSTLTLTYSSDQSFEVYIIPLDSNDNYNPLDMVHVSLASTQGERSTVDINLAASPSWTLLRERYLFQFISTAEDTNAGIYDTQFSGPGAVELIGILWKHLFFPEPYLPSSYHVLRGYRILNGYLAIILGIVSCTVVVAILLWKKTKGIPTALTFLALFMMLYGLRSSIDLLLFTKEHLSSWHTDGRYDEAQNVYDIAAYIHTLDPQTSPQIFVCRDGTNFREKLLRYFAYPLPIYSADRQGEGKPTHIIVMGKREWSFENDTLTCGDISSRATLLETFPDGTTIFALLQP